MSVADMTASTMRARLLLRREGRGVTGEESGIA
jgi:hypothetical protein